MARESGGRGYGLLATMLLIMAWNAAAWKYAVENYLGVTSPDYIKGRYHSAIDNFGLPLYAGTMMGSVVYREENRRGCNTYNTAFDSWPGGLPTIVLVDRGDCYFLLKVWNAQSAGAEAVLVSDDREEPLITMDSLGENGFFSEYFQNITIPSALIEKNLGDKLKKALSEGDMVNINLVWRDFVPHIDERVEYELWTDGNHEWGLRSTMQMEFLKNFKGVAQILEKSGYTQFTPHYITWQCPQAFIASKQCKTQCINQGRYCAVDLEQEFSWGYDGKDVVIDNLRQLCVFKVAKEDNRPWVWWDYVTDFNIRCLMIGKKYIKECADSVLKSLSLDSKKIEKCMGDPNVDTQNPILEVEQDAQVEHGSRGAITISPTLVINDRQYRGKLDKGHVMQEICSGYKETIQPAICLNDDMKTDECLLNNGGCWEDKKTNITACKDTFRGRVCKCPLVNGVQFKGDGYTHCDGSNLEFQELSSGVVDKKDGSELWIRKMVRAVSRLEIDFSWRKLYI